MESGTARRNWALGLTAATDARIAKMARSKTGKANWSRGLTAATDPRIARNAASRLGRPRGPYRTAGRGDLHGLVEDARSVLNEDQYSDYVYLLGMYLGDGCLAKYPRTYRLEIFLDPKYPNLIEECARAMRVVHQYHRANIRRKRSEVVVNSYGLRWLQLFPQHGPGRKHERPIVLAPWQEVLVGRHLWEFLRGCLDSEGCRSRRIVNGKNYPFYSFSNKSTDILGLFTSTCDRLGVHYTRPRPAVVSIARRADVARLDEHLPRKS